MLLSDVRDLLAGSPFANVFQQLYMLHGYADDSPFVDYAAYVRGSTREWYLNTLPSYKSESSASKLKTLMNNLINPSKFPQVAALLPEEERVHLGSRMSQVLRELVTEGHFKPRPKRRAAPSDDYDDVSVEPQTEDGGDDRVGGNMVQAASDADVMAKKLSLAKQMILQLLEGATPDDNLKSFAKTLVETFL